MSFPRKIGVVAVAVLGSTGFFFASTACMGFGGVGVGGVAVGVGAPGVAISAGVAPGVTGGGLTAGTSVSVGGSSVTAGGGAAVGSGGATGGVGAAADGGITVGGGGITANGSAGADVGGTGTTAGASATDAVGTTTGGATLAAQRAALQMGVGPLEPDRGMAQALGYAAAAAAAVTASADTALQSAVSGLPALPSVTAAVEASAGPAGSSARIGTQSDSSASAAQDQSDEPPGRSRHPDPPPDRRPVVASGAGPAAPRGAKAPSTLKRPDRTVTKASAHRADKPAAQEKAAAAVVVNPGAAPVTSIVADSDPPVPDLAGQRIRNWSISGDFPDAQTSSLPTGLAIVLVMVLSAASAWGFVRVMSQRCPRCSALLERHSAGCRNCGAHLPASGRSGLRLSS